MEQLAIWGEFLGGIGVIASLLFLGLQTRTANILALAASQREMRHIWQENLFYLGDKSSEYREFMEDFENMEPDRQLKAAHGVVAMGNMVDTMLKLRKLNLETDDTTNMLLSAFTGIVKTPGGQLFWQQMNSAGFWGDDLRNEVNKALADSSNSNAPSINEALSFLRPR